ncbi:MAG: DNRLRE domain-containing protein [Verrucomicrobiota bacterium]
MSISQNDKDRIQRALERLLTPEETERFQADVVRSPELREAYVERLWLHSTLRADSDRLPEIFQATPSTEVKIIRRWPLILTGAAAACLTLGALFLGFGKQALLQNNVAVLVQADNCKWAGSELPTALHSKLGTGTLALVEGIATLRFKNGATVSIEAPTTLQILNSMHCRLLEGSLTADIPEPAHGFTVDTPDMKVIDWGTKFGVTAGSTGHSHVRVFEGQVEVAGSAKVKNQRLNKGQGLHVDSGYTSPEQEPARGQQVLENDGWTAIPTSFGRGKDAYVRRGDEGGLMGSNPLLLVKHSDLEASKKNERRAILTFDLSNINPASVTETQLLLDPKPSGFGFPSLVPDSRFAVYGITDESLDQWDEATLRWSTLPANTEAGPDPKTSRKLAEFWIPRGGSSAITVRGDELAAFLRTRTNGLASFLIIRETGETDPSGLVHAFASKEYPGAIPPTLRIR